MGIAHGLEDGLLVLHCTGDFGLAGASDALRRALDDIPHATNLPLLICDTDSDILPAAADCLKLAQSLRRAVPRISPHIALVVDRDVKFGIGRLTGVHCEELGLDFRVFRSRDKAEAWLRVASALSFRANAGS